MTETNISISNKALVKCGAETIASFTEGTHESNVCSTMYETTKQGLLYYTFWNFAVAKQSLNLLAETPTDAGFTYAHSTPGDVIRIKSVFDTNGDSIEDYSVEGQKIYSNTQTLFLEYIQDMDEQYFPVFFIEALVSKMAYEINEAITGIGSLSDRLLNDFNIKIRAARIADGQENPPRNVMPAGRLIEAHLGNSSIG
tara:strand:+ start:743 stop:1336 length:594 start_codon:yes stop_codon:yes gene_type:complete